MNELFDLRAFCQTAVQCLILQYASGDVNFVLVIRLHYDTPEKLASHKFDVAVGTRTRKAYHCLEVEMHIE